MPFAVLGTTAPNTRSKPCSPNLPFPWYTSVSAIPHFSWQENAHYCVTSPGSTGVERETAIRKEWGLWRRWDDLAVTPRKQWWSLGGVHLIFLSHHLWRSCLHRKHHWRISESILHLASFFCRSFQSPDEILKFPIQGLSICSQSFISFHFFRMTTGANERTLNYIDLLWQSLCQHWALTMHITVQLMYFWWHILQCYI